MSVVTIYNDGKIAVQLMADKKGNTIVGTINGKLNGATPKQFLKDLPVCKEFMDEMKEDPTCWKMVQDAIIDGLEQRASKEKE